VALTEIEVAPMLVLIGFTVTMVSLGAIAVSIAWRSQRDVVDPSPKPRDVTQSYEDDDTRT
jgi:hypothetical protein